MNRCRPRSNRRAKHRPVGASETAPPPGRPAPLPRLPVPPAHPRRCSAPPAGYAGDLCGRGPCQAAGRDHAAGEDGPPRASRPADCCLARQRVATYTPAQLWGFNWVVAGSKADARCRLLARPRGSRAQAAPRRAMHAALWPGQARRKQAVEQTISSGSRQALQRDNLASTRPHTAQLAAAGPTGPSGSEMCTGGPPPIGWAVASRLMPPLPMWPLARTSAPPGAAARAALRTGSPSAWNCSYPCELARC
jgi:hypothetical protein